MCLTGVDYFSSMGFQPGIAFLAAGLLSPVATLNLVLLTLLGALPTYWLVAKESPHGRGSFAIFENLLKGWKGKTLVLVLLGFAATDFVFTITMCAADATAHIIENPWVPAFLHDRLLWTLSLIGLLGAIFLLGFQEAIRVSFFLVALYLGVNAITLTACCSRLLAEPHYFSDWVSKVSMQYSSPWQAFMVSFFVFPQLALGLSGFETGVAVMPLIRTTHQDERLLAERVRNTRILLVTVALIMSAFLLVGCVAATLLIPAELFQENREANGRALAYLTHKLLGDDIGAIYDIATVSILWFAGASGMAALLSLVPQYLPRYGMAPSWSAATRPLVIFIMLVSLVITCIFKAEVDPQAGAFATGLLVLICSAVVAITIAKWNSGWGYRIVFSLISAMFIYASIDIMWIRPDGLLISIFFILAILASSLVSRALRSTELRIANVTFDSTSMRFIDEASMSPWGEVRLLAHRPLQGGYAEKESAARRLHTFDKTEGYFIFLEVTTEDVSNFLEDKLEVTGHEEDGYQILRCRCFSVPNAIAAILLSIRERTKKMPHAYFDWTEGNPLTYVLKFVILGEGETAPLTREILRSAEPDPNQRPKIHVA